jgi:Methane oxygenase PmoA
MLKYLVVFSLLVLNAFSQSGVKLKNLPTENKISVEINGKLFTNYYYPGKDVLKKAVLFPIFSPQGTSVTRGWPINPLPGERVDHPHHVGAWLNYEDANGHDFWNNSIEVEKSGDKRIFGTIVHTGVTKMSSSKKQGILIVTADWLDNKGEIMLKETTKYVFSSINNSNIIDRTTTLKAAGNQVVFKDVKDGFFAIRVARELEMPSNKPEIFTDAKGLATNVPSLDNTNITGNYINAEGIEGEKTWGVRSAWVTLQGKIKNEDISISIVDHPKNAGYPSYWHTRGYGLFSVNPLGQKVFSNGKETLNLTLKPTQETTFRYRMIISSEKMAKEQLNKLAKDFSVIN